MPGPRAPVFVVGYMHSGTTLLQDILGRHPDLFSGRGESKFFEFLPTIRTRHPDLSDAQQRRALVETTLRAALGGFSATGILRPPPPELAVLDGIDPALIASVESEAAAARDHGDLFRLACEHLAHRAGKPRWLEKTPTHVFHIDEIVRSVPDALFVEITRDPRDVLASKKTRRTSVWSTDRYPAEQRPLKHLEKAFDPLWDALSWKAAIAAGRAARARYPGRVHRVSYESLVVAAEPTVREICAFLGLTFEPAMMEVAAANTADWTGARQGRGIYGSSVGRWASVLSSAEVAVCQSVLRHELEELGYEAAALSATDRARAVPLLMVSASELAIRLSRRWRMGGLAMLRNTLIGYGARARALARADSRDAARKDRPA